MNNEKALRLIGLCRRSGNCACGATQAEYAIKSGKAKLLIITEDCGDATKEKFIGFAEKNQVKYMLVFDKRALGKAVSYKELSLVCITDENFAHGILKCAEEMEEI